MAPLLNQIPRWLKHPKVWRFSGFASAVVGLLCYALSSSFNSLFGEWKLWKAFLYCVFSFIICTAVLLAKTWPHSSSLRFKAHIAFLVLTITSFYSSFFDKHANGKPDAYSLVSSAAFAVMSLSLSRQTHFGYEVDLLYFFLGALIVQLTKIEWLLGIVGMGFSYSLIILRSCLDAPEANGHSVLQPQPHVSIRVCSLQILTCVGELKKKNPSLITLVYSYKYQDPEKSFEPDHNLFIDAIPSEIINNLNEAMKLAVAAGLEEECCHLYSSCRREFLLECLSAVNLQDLFNNEYHNASMTTERIWSWVTASDFAFHILFPNERRLCDRIFSGLSSARDLSFVQICMENTICLLNFPRTFKFKISMPKNCSEVVEEVLRTLNGIILELESLFPDKEAVSLRNEAITTCKRLAEAMGYVFKDMENLIHCDARSPDVPGGIYPIVEDVVNCFREVIKLKPAIEELWEEYPLVWSPSFAQIPWIMELLERHLEARSENYTEPALYYVSMMNNTMYIKQEIEKLPYSAWIIGDNSGGNLRLGSTFRNHQILKLMAKVQQNLEDYGRSSWDEVLGLLKLDNEEESALPRVAESMKEKLQLFNIQLEQICSIQSQWFASDDIRKEIIKLLERMLLPAYGYFIRRFQDVLGKHSYEYIQYGMLDISDQLNCMFLVGKRMNQLPKEE